MGPVSRWAVNRPWQAIIAWVVLLFIVGFGVLTHAGQYNDSFTLPNTDSSKPSSYSRTTSGPRRITRRCRFCLPQATNSSRTLPKSSCRAHDQPDQGHRLGRKCAVAL